MQRSVARQVLQLPKPTPPASLRKMDRHPRQHLPARALSSDTLWEWAQAVLVQFMAVLLALETWLHGPARLPGTEDEVDSSTARRNSGPRAVPSQGQGSSSSSAVPSRAPAAGSSAVGAQPKTKPGKKSQETPIAKEAIPDEKTMRRWSRKKVDFGKHEARGKTYADAKEQHPDHAKWVLKNCRPDSKKSFTEEMIDYANYLRLVKAIEDQSLVSENSKSDTDEESEGSMELVPDA